MDLRKRTLGVVLCALVSAYAMHAEQTAVDTPPMEPAEAATADTAIAPDPGIPSASAGTMAPATTALLADSGAAIASSTPVPNSSDLFDHRFSSL